jgi:DNA-binding PadR family transcriptional regulator
MEEIKPDTFLPLHNNWFHILLSLVGNEQHGYGIMQEVLERTGGAVRIWPATLYGALQRMIAGGLIEESEERPAPELDDARRRYYRLTRLGRTVLDLECERMRDMLRMAQRKRKQEAY